MFQDFLSAVFFDHHRIASLTESRSWVGQYLRDKHNGVIPDGVFSFYKLPVQVLLEEEYQWDELLDCYTLKGCTIPAHIVDSHGNPPSWTAESLDRCVLHFDSLEGNPAKLLTVISNTPNWKDPQMAERRMWSQLHQVLTNKEDLIKCVWTSNPRKDKKVLPKNTPDPQLCHVYGAIGIGGATQYTHLADDVNRIFTTDQQPMVINGYQLRGHTTYRQAALAHNEHMKYKRD